MYISLPNKHEDPRLLLLLLSEMRAVVLGFLLLGLVVAVALANSATEIAGTVLANPYCDGKKNVMKTQVISQLPDPWPFKLQLICDGLGSNAMDIGPETPNVLSQYYAIGPVAGSLYGVECQLNLLGVNPYSNDTSLYTFGFFNSPCGVVKQTVNETFNSQSDSRCAYWNVPCHFKDNSWGRNILCHLMIDSVIVVALVFLDYILISRPDKKIRDERHQATFSPATQGISLTDWRKKPKNGNKQKKKQQQQQQQQQPQQQQVKREMEESDTSSKMAEEDAFLDGGGVGRIPGSSKVNKRPTVKVHLSNK